MHSNKTTRVGSLSLLYYYYAQQQDNQPVKWKALWQVKVMTISFCVGASLHYTLPLPQRRLAHE